MDNSPLTVLRATDKPINLPNYINYRVKDEPRWGVLLTTFIDTLLLKRSSRMGKSYLKRYRTLIYHLNRFSIRHSVEIYTNSINEEFFDDFIFYLESENLKLGYIKNLVDLTKATARRAANYGYAIDPSFNEVFVKEEDTPHIYLSMGEIARIYYYTGLTKFQERIRDLFIVGCLTAMRYSDYSTLTPDNFQGNFIIKVTKKTGKKVKVPIHDYIKEIYNKYQGNIVFGYSLQYFNRYLKLICKKVGLVELIPLTYTKGGKLLNHTEPKWKLVSSHTARRSAATNMALTGHTTEKSFFRYVRVTQEDISDQISTDIFFRK